MTRKDLKKYIISLIYLPDQKKQSYIDQVDELEEDKVDQVYAALFYRYNKYFSKVGDLVEKFEKDYNKTVHEFIKNKSEVETNSKLEQIRNNLSDV
jgi:hypothetical protein